MLHCSALMSITIIIVEGNKTTSTRQKQNIQYSNSPGVHHHNVHYMQHLQVSNLF